MHTATAWHALDRDELETTLATGDHGLSDREAEDRLRETGPNEIETDTRTSDLTILARQLKSPLVLIFIVAGAVTTALGEYLDTIVIGAVIVLNTGIGFVQERQAERSVQALLEFVSPARASSAAARSTRSPAARSCRATSCCSNRACACRPTSASS